MLKVCERVAVTLLLRISQKKKKIKEIPHAKKLHSRSTVLELFMS